MSRRGSLVKREAIVQRLRSRGRALFDDPPPSLRFSDGVTRFTRELRRYPHAFVFACIFDRQVPSQRSEQATLELARRLGVFSFPALARLTKKRLRAAMTRPTKLHRFHGDMTVNIYEAIRLIESKYAGDAARIWNDSPSAAQLVARFREFRGMGPKLANVAATILARDFHIGLRDLSGIDVSPDVHVGRALWRLGLLPRDASADQVIRRGRQMNPSFPGLLDLPLWEVGQSWCHPAEPECAACYMRDVCPSAPKARSRFTSEFHFHHS